MKSRFIEALKKLSQSSISPLGFGRRKEGAKSPMLLIAALDAVSGERLPESLSPVDALIFAGSKAGKDALRQSMKSNPAPWGMALKSSKDTAEAKELGFDFIVFSAQETEASILRTEEVGKVMEINMNLADSQLRSVELLPVDALLLPFPAKASSLTVENLLAYQRIDLLVTKPLIGYVPAKISGEDLRLLWEAGLDGAVIKAEGLSGKEVERLREVTKSFPPHRGEKKRFEALLPSIAATIPGEQEDEPEQGRPAGGG